MKSADFFIDKAREYTNSIDEILPGLLHQSEQEPASAPGHTAQSERISDIRLKTKKLFSEFDKGEIFRENIASIDSNKMLVAEEEEVLERYKHTLSLFIHHVTEGVK